MIKCTIENEEGDFGLEVYEFEGQISVESYDDTEGGKTYGRNMQITKKEAIAFAKSILNMLEGD